MGMKIIGVVNRIVYYFLFTLSLFSQASLSFFLSLTAISVSQIPHVTATNFFFFWIFNFLKSSLSYFWIKVSWIIFFNSSGEFSFFFSLSLFISFYHLLIFEFEFFLIFSKIHQISNRVIFHF